MANRAAQQAKIAAQRAAAAQAAANKEAARVAAVWAQREKSKPADPNFDYVWREPTVRNGVVVKKSGWEAIPKAAVTPVTPSFEQMFPGVNRVTPFTPLELEAQQNQVALARQAPDYANQISKLLEFQAQQTRPIIDFTDRFMTPEALAGRPNAQSQTIINQLLGDRSLEDQNAFLQQTYLSPEALEGRPNAQTQSLIDQILANREGKQLREQLWNTYMTPEALAGRPGDQAQGIINQILANEEGNRLNADIFKRFLSDEALNIANNKIWQDAANAAIQPMQAQFMEEVLPQLRAQGIESGGLGGTRLALAGGLATDKFNQAALNTRANIFAEAQKQALANALQGGSLISQNNESYAQRQQGIAALLEQLRESAQNRGLQAGGMIQAGDENYAARQQAIAGLLQQARENAQQRGVSVSGLISGNNQFRQGVQGDISKFLQQTSENARNAGLAAAQMRLGATTGLAGAGNDALANILRLQDAANQSLANIGGAQRQMNQDNINSILARIDSQRSLTDQYFNDYLQRIGSVNAGGTQSTYGMMPGGGGGGFGNIARGALGGGLTGAGVGSALAGLGGAAGGAAAGAAAGSVVPIWGTAIGALAGGLYGALS
jgi:hypothetical protein